MAFQLGSLFVCVVLESLCRDRSHLTVRRLADTQGLGGNTYRAGLSHRRWHLALAIAGPQASPQASREGSSQICSAKRKGVSGGGSTTEEEDEVT